MRNQLQSPQVIIYDSANQLLAGGVISLNGMNLETAVTSFRFKNTDEDENECTINIAFNDKKYASHPGLRKGSRVISKFGYIPNLTRSIQMVIINKHYTYSSEGYVLTLTLTDEAVYKDKYIDQDVSSLFDIFRLIVENGSKVSMIIDNISIVDPNHYGLEYNTVNSSWNVVDYRDKERSKNNKQNLQGNDNIKNFQPGKALREKQIFFIDKNEDGRFNFPTSKKYENKVNPENFFDYNPYKSEKAIGTTSELMAKILLDSNIEPYVFKPPNYRRTIEEPISSKGITKAFIEDLQLEINNGDPNKLVYNKETGSLTYDGDPNSKIQIYSRRLGAYATLKELEEIRTLKNDDFKIKNRRVNQNGLVVYTLSRTVQFAGKSVYKETTKPFSPTDYDYDTFEEAFLAIMYKKLIADAGASREDKEVNIDNPEKYGNGLLKRILSYILLDGRFTGDVNTKAIALAKKVMNKVSDEPLKISTDGDVVTLHNSGNTDKPKAISRVLTFEEDLDFGREIISIDINTDNKAANIKKFNIYHDDEEEKINSELEGKEATVDVTETDEDTTYDFNEEKFLNIIKHWERQFKKAQEEAVRNNTETIIPPVVFDLTSFDVDQIEIPLKLDIITKGEKKTLGGYKKVFDQNDEGNFLLRIPAKFVLAYPGVMDMLKKEAKNKIAEVEKKRNQLTIIIKGFMNLYPGQNILLKDLDPQYNKIWTLKTVEHNVDVNMGYTTVLTGYLPLADSTTSQYVKKFSGINTELLDNPKFKDLSLIQQIVANYVTSGNPEASVVEGDILQSTFRENTPEGVPVEYSPIGEEGEYEIQSSGLKNYEKSPGENVNFYNTYGNPDRD